MNTAESDIENLYTLYGEGPALFVKKGDYEGDKADLYAEIAAVGTAAGEYTDEKVKALETSIGE